MSQTANTPDTITHVTRSALIKSGIVIEHGLATIAAEWLTDRFTGATEGRFVMRGPSGVHSLLIDATDAARLDAHWQVFCSDHRNQVAAAA
jgi:hypothetical protein